MAEKMVRLRIKRQDDPQAASYWENFEVPWEPGMNVISALLKIQDNPVTAEGKKTKPVVWDSGCLEEVCGACSMNINDTPRQSCSALVDKLEQPIKLEPFKRFPVVRDLVVDRTKMFEALKRVKAWIPIDGTYDMGEGPKMAEAKREKMYSLARCMTCGCCLEACPQITERSPFIGAAAISQVRLFNGHPTGAMNAHERLDALVGPGGISDCGNAQNCVQVCPKHIPLTDSIADVGGQVSRHVLKKMFIG